MSHGILALALSIVQLAPPSDPAETRIYGRVVTADGRQLEGYLRWDRNETQWADFLDGRKEIPWEQLREAEGLDAEFRRRRELERSIGLPGLRITWDEDDGEPRTTAAAIRFGHLRTLQVVGRDRVELELVSGERIELRSGSSDIGRSFRGLVVEDRVRGEVELRWSDLDRVDFRVAPLGSPPPAAARLYGTLRTRSGVELTGFVSWDMDEALTTDVLDGRDGRRRREIAFSSISAIEREGGRSVRVTLCTGERLVLSGTNDVNSENRGIEIAEPTFGRAVVSWRDFASLTLHPAGPGSLTAASRASFQGGGRLSGVVETKGGERLRGRIRWDLDEEATWEVLDGRSQGVDYGFELAAVRSLESAGPEGSRVTLGDGRSFLLEGSTDVSEENQGIIVWTEDRGAVFVHWRDFARVTFGP